MTRPQLLRREVHRACREALEYHLVGAERAARYWRRREARLRYRLAQATYQRDHIAEDGA